MRGKDVVPLLLAALVLTGCGDDSKDAAKPVVRPVLSVVLGENDPDQTGFAGMIQPRYQVDLSFRMFGRVIARDVSVGDRVEKDQVVAALDPAALNFALVSAKGSVNNAKAQYDNAAATEKRQSILLQQNNISSQQYEAARQALASAEAALVQAKASLSKAEEQRGYADLKAEYDGIVTATHIEVGQTVAAGQAAITIAKPDIREALVDLPVEQAGRVHVGSRFTVVLEMNPLKTTPGHVREIAPQVDVLTRTRRIKIALDAPGPDFRIGSTVKVFMSRTADEGFIVPVTSLLTEDGKTFVWIADPDKQTVSRQAVTVLSRFDRDATIGGAGLKAGLHVVVAGVHSLKEGQAVKIPQTPPTAPETAMSHEDTP
ncbi:efflux RND transporter periplasmic adaptor subunit [Allorhizobium sp. BGMRC 0089]|uniref:efflux RND transporter periplasmic adaptor subunit n=1 Tax=Allorhizobium sonneratiae TaxID=2934936 RepID=UPI002033CAEA|nr:efflux RND transporter periplasmic adaptor subunit [Allorhizobium sonneratiae]MCM2292463.1 efflux RND transporter periplasmic adaptor subunit [Allorhizobium sonneratiae]